MRILTHPNVVTFFGAWKKGSDLFVSILYVIHSNLVFLNDVVSHGLQIAMELCGGGAASDLYSSE